MSQNTKTTLTVLGFLFLALGFFTLSLNFVGVDFTFMHWMQALGAMTSFLIKIGLVMLGFILIYFGQVDLEREEV